jgi:hypothetical protein
VGSSPLSASFHKYGDVCGERDDDAMSVTSWRRRDKEIDAVPPQPFGLMEVAVDLCVARRRRCPSIASSSLLDLPSQAPSANIIVFMERDTKIV